MNEPSKKEMVAVIYALLSCIEAGEIPEGMEKWAAKAHRIIKSYEAAKPPS